MKYGDIDPSISTSALKALSRRLWYLTEEMVTLAFFSIKTDSNEKYLIAKRLAEVQHLEARLPEGRYGFGFGKPRFPQNVGQDTQLFNLIGKHS